MSELVNVLAILMLFVSGIALGIKIGKLKLAAIRQQTIEECAEICDKLEEGRPNYSWTPSPEDCAAAIRSLAQEKGR